MTSLLPVSPLQASSEFKPPRRVDSKCWALSWTKPLELTLQAALEASARNLGPNKEGREQILRESLLEKIFSTDAGALVYRWPNWMHMVGSFRWQDPHTLILSWHMIQAMWGQRRLEVPSSLEQDSRLHSHLNMGRRFYDFVNLQENLLLDLQKAGVREVWIYAHDVRQKSLAKALERSLRFTPSDRPGSWLRIDKFPTPEDLAP